MLAAAPITDSSCREKLPRAQNRESFLFCPWHCTDTMKVWGSHPGLQEILDPYWEPGTALAALSLCRKCSSWAWSCPCIPLLPPLAQTSVCVQFACVLWLSLAGARAHALFPTAPCREEHSRATTVPFHLRMLLFEAAGLQGRGTGLSYVCKKLQWDSWAAITGWADALGWRLMHNSLIQFTLLSLRPDSVASPGSGLAQLTQQG